ncbi:MAG: hypothetical protein WC644_08965 [Ignavibacteria bacterium]
MARELRDNDDLKDNNEIERSIAEFDRLNFKSKEPLDEKLNELIELLEKSELDSDKAQEYLYRIENSIKNQSLKNKFGKFKDVANDDDISRDKMINEFEFLLSSSDLNSEDAFRYLKKEKHKILILSILGVLFIILGLGMIILPAPQNFEMFTIFYFTRDDGITLMDVIASIITVSGIFILVNNLRHLKSNL